MQEVYGTDLVNTLGELAEPHDAMVNKYYEGGIVPSEVVETGEGERMAFPGFDWPTLTKEAADEVARCVDNMELPRAAAAALALVVKVDLFITETEPFRMAKDETKKEELAAVLYQCLETLRIACVLLEPFLPDKMAEVGENMALGEGTFDERVRGAA